LSDFISIKEALTQGKGNIRFIVASIGELKPGHTKTGDEWQKQIAVIKDASGVMNLTLWNQDIGEIIDGKSYTLENAYWTEYHGKPQLSLGKYYKLNEISQLPTSDGFKGSSGGTITTPTLSADSNVQEEFEAATQAEMLARIYDMTKEMYHDFIDRKIQS